MVFIKFHMDAMAKVYSTSAAALRDRQGRLREEYTNAGEGTPPEYIEGVGWPPNPREAAIDLDDEIESALSELRVWLTVSLYHTFEKKVISLTRTTELKIWPAIKNLKQYGIVFDTHLLNELRLAANATKHGPLSEDMKLLKEQRPDLVAGDEVIISQEQFDTFCGIFREMRIADSVP
ncbi:hypothetical protein [Devosia sp.]|uniref:hypothetical protein n=1 Tax=Devosia sp. TaxID=1871048 RepID=UPI002627D1B2|nr:hypothetical protein [Devosia sp.]